MFTKLTIERLKSAIENIDLEKVDFYNFINFNKNH